MTIASASLFFFFKISSLFLSVYFSCRPISRQLEDDDRRYSCNFRIIRNYDEICLHHKMRPEHQSLTNCLFHMMNCKQEKLMDSRTVHISNESFLYNDRPAAGSENAHLNVCFLTWSKMLRLLYNHM